MKTLFQKITTAIGLTLLLGLVSCEKEDTLNPNPLGGARSEAVNDVTLPSTTPKVYKLTKIGGTTLSYDSNGQLRKVTEAFTRGGQDSHTDYTYGAGSIRAVSYKGQVVVRDETFTLDPSGRCTESDVKGTVSDTKWKFTYDAKGRLWSCQNKNSCIGGVSYSYNPDGDLSLATVATSPTDGMALSFAYNLSPGGPLADDQYPLNVVGAKEHDAYLPIFGRGSRHLVRFVTYKSSNFAQEPSDQYFSYSVNADGYVIKKDEYTGLNGAVPQTTVYDYMVSTLSVQH